MRRRFCVAFVYLQILVFVNASGYYSIVAPGTIQSNHDYSISVTIHENSEPATIKVGILGPSYNETKTVDVSASQTEVVNFKVPRLKYGDYKLESEGIKGLIFKNSTDLNFKNKEPKVYIQTDKATYKPGDLVQYRVIVLNEETRPAKLEQPLRLSFKDGASNYVKQINDIKLPQGVYSGEFQLSEQPVLGDWMIEVSLGPKDDETKTKKKFEVAKYILPKFSVDIETAKDIATGDPLKITVRSKYTYGKPVKGQATITVSANNGLLNLEKVVDVDGKGHVEFNIPNDIDIIRPLERYCFRCYNNNNAQINILAVMTEEYTGNKQNKTTTVNLHRSRYTIEVPNNVYEHNANKTFELKAFIKNLDGTPLQDGKHKAELIIERRPQFAYYNTIPEGDPIVIPSELDKNGMALFKVTLPAGHFFNAKVTYENQVKYLPSLSIRAEPEDKEAKDDKANGEEDVGPLKLVQKTERVQLDEDVIVEVKSNKNIPYYVYAIVARGNIIKQEHVKLPENVKSHEIRFKPSFKMVPESHLYVYFVLESDLKFKEMTLNFPKEFQNKIEITAPKQAKPSEQVTLSIKTDPDSFVGLLGVDQSVLLLQSGNDLDSEKIINDLSSYDTSTPYVRGFGDYPGKLSGLITQTNANYPYTAKLSQEDLDYETLQEEFASEDETDSFDYQTSVAQTKTNKFNIQLRKNFVEMWIWNSVKNFRTDANGLATLTKSIPDTITSWVITGFSLNDKTGFGMVANPTKINVFQPFFVSTNLPYSVKRGEVISIPVLVFNYMDKALDAEVTMENTDEEYDFTEVSNEIEELVLEEKQKVKRVTVPSNSGKSVSFMIRPNKVGEITLKIKAITPLAGDAIHQKLKVEPEGVTQYENQAIFITPPASKEPAKETLKAVIPKEAVLDSEYLEFSVVGDILGPTIENIDKLIRQPYGCGEQNMVNFVPNILVLHYLDAIKREMPTVVQKAKNFMESGYQRELTYKHKNGAYSAFGEGSSEPNSWLTAYVARSFIQAKTYITIDQGAIDDALKYLLSNQLESGQFKQTGRLFHPSHQNDVGFTAFALLALMEDEDISNKYKTEIEKSIKYLVDNIDEENDTYALAIAIVVLKKAQHPSAGKLMEKLENLAHEENGLKWWTKASNNIEITAYILEAYVYSEPAGKLLPIIKWLITNRNSMGGFDSTQDTVTGLQALISFAEKYINAGDGKMTIKFEAQDSEGNVATKGSFSVDKENSLQVQTHVLPKATRQIILEAEGEGSPLVQLSYRYNLATQDDKPSFNINHTILKTPYRSLLQMNVCADYVPGADNDIKESNMALMEIYLPSGFTADADKLDKIREIKQVQRVETKNSDTAIIIYFDYLAAGKEVCLDVIADKTHAVAKQKPAAITIYDYYNSDERATVYYEVKSSLCDICEEGECGQGCEKKEDQ